MRVMFDICRPDSMVVSSAAHWSATQKSSRAGSEHEIQSMPDAALDEFVAMWIDCGNDGAACFILLSYVGGSWYVPQALSPITESKNRRFPPSRHQRGRQ